MDNITTEGLERKYKGTKYVDVQIAKFMKEGVIEVPSPKIRRRMYEILKHNKIKWRAEVVGYTEGRKDISRWNRRHHIGWNLKIVAKWIGNKRITAEDLQNACDVCNSYGTIWFNFDEISDVFNDISSFQDKCNLIEEKWGKILDMVKWTPFDLCPLRKTIVRITKV